MWRRQGYLSNIGSVKEIMRLRTFFTVNNDITIYVCEALSKTANTLPPERPV